MAFVKSAFSVFLIWALLVCVSGLTGDMFNCQREGITCDNGGTCDVSTGTACTCGTGTTQTLGYHCISNNLLNSKCSVTDFCQNGGLCYKLSNVNTCFCPQLYTGTNCETPRIKVDCATDGMKVTVAPHGSFAGRMYAAGKSAVAACMLTLEAGSSPALYSQTFSYTTNICGLSKTENKDGSNNVLATVYTAYVIVQYTSSLNIVMATDQRITASCTMPSNGAVKGATINSGVQVSHLDDASGLGNYWPIEMSIVDDSGTPITTASQFTLWQPLTLRVLLLATNTWPRDRVETCTASNRPSSDWPGYSEFDLVVNSGCPADNKVVRGNHVHTPTAGGGSLIEIPFYAFLFPDGDIYFRCQVKLCSSGDVSNAGCDAPDPDTCPGTFKEGHGRKRRESPGETTVTPSLSIKVIVPGNSTTQPHPSVYAGGMTAGCMKNPELLALISLLCIVIVIAFIAFIVSLVIFCRHNQHSKF